MSFEDANASELRRPVLSTSKIFVFLDSRFLQITFLPLFPTNICHTLLVNRNNTYR